MSGAPGWRYGRTRKSWARRVAKQEINGRRVNEAIERGRLGESDEGSFVCECGRIGCNVTRPGSNTGRGGDFRRPAAEQSTWTCFESVGILPFCNAISCTPMWSTWPSRTTFSIPLSSSISAVLNVAL